MSTMKSLSTTGLSKVGGHKADGGKLDFSLLPTVLWHLVQVYTLGAIKYGRGNYKKGMKFSRIFAATCRHLFRWWWFREKLDPIDGQHHLASAAWGCLTLMEYESIHPDKDDRVNGPADELITLFPEKGIDYLAMIDVKGWEDDVPIKVKLKSKKRKK